MPRSYHYGAVRIVAAPLGFPSDAAARVRIPDDWTVWATADVHGMARALERVLEQARLTDDAGGWIAPPRTALVVVGDMIDRGPDSRATVELLRRLETDAARRGSRVVLVRGNHEQMLADLLRGEPEWWDAWRASGGRATLGSFGVREQGLRDTMADLHRADPALTRWLLATLPYARWRDVLLVHAGLVPGGDLETLLDEDGQLWQSSRFVPTAGVAYEPAFAGYRRAGIGRVVMGHVPQLGGPSVEHAGTLLMLDSHAYAPAGGALALVRLPRAGSFADSRFVIVEPRGRG